MLIIVEYDEMLENRVVRLGGKREKVKKKLVSSKELSHSL